MVLTSSPTVVQIFRKSCEMSKKVLDIIYFICLYNMRWGRISLYNVCWRDIFLYNICWTHILFPITYVEHTFLSIT